jgi:tRNA nucleotidyltransferase (CCA-adding enzyme)
MMDIFTVGGAVRDKLLGLTPKDRDYVVVGGSAQAMLDAGYLQVGADFPVFLHPESQDEYALARVERKTAVGYHGFAVYTAGVTLEEDLSRRDLSINAMAMDDAGNVIDPYGGQHDLAAKVLRHVSEAFAEDPLRVLRLARFQARFGPSWTVAADTMALMQSMVVNGELDALTRERVWVEFEKGFGEPHPQLMLQVLRELGLFDRPGFAEYAHFGTCDLAELAYAAEQGAALPVRVAMTLCRDWTREEIKASRIPSDIREAAQALHRVKVAGVEHFVDWTAGAKLALLESLDVLRRPACFDTVCQTLALRHPEVSLALLLARAQLRDIDQGAVVKGLTLPADIKAAIRQARIAALASV